jgi:SAM-dependent methyltransferase
MNKQKKAWEKEYNNPIFLSKKSEPQADVLRFFKFLRKEEGFLLSNKSVLDLGCGTGRNSNYLSSLGCDVIGIDFSQTALNLAISRAKKDNLNVNYILASIGDDYDIESSSIDVALDITSSNSLNEKERINYLKEVQRVLKSGGYFFVRALSKDGNKNVKNLLKTSPGKERDTYIIKDIDLTERVFSRNDFLNLYSKFFHVLELRKKHNYTRFKDRVYKRDYWIAYLKK